MESCIYTEDCAWAKDCVKPCEKYQKRYPLGFTLSAIFLACALLYIAGFVTYGFGRAAGREEGRVIGQEQGRQERVSRATCMQYGIELEERGIKYGWRKW